MDLHFTLTLSLFPLECTCFIDGVYAKFDFVPPFFTLREQICRIRFCVWRLISFHVSLFHVTGFLHLQEVFNMYRHCTDICNSNIFKKFHRIIFCDQFLLGKMCSSKSSRDLLSRLIFIWKNLWNLILCLILLMLLSCVL